ncbi:hypothetical protein Dda_0585 [Drechslerella dactyloides]|uniref:RNB domain-containing protein n=1 Tax=Drechslerella dactyloides TaxID=74499 RepID=A0AAD6J6K9_DREDA|nr:hypothetical protein Dda_0585 [Drechslerella dactyloides]
MSLQCPRCTLIASIRSSSGSIRPPLRTPRISPTPPPYTRPHATALQIRALSTTLSRPRGLAEKQKWHAHQERRDEMRRVVAEKLQRKIPLQHEDRRYINAARHAIRDETGQQAESPIFGFSHSEVSFTDGSTMAKPGYQPRRDEAQDGGRHPANRKERAARQMYFQGLEALEDGHVHVDQVSGAMRRRLNQEWEQREEERRAAFQKGTSVDAVMDRIVEETQWQAGQSEDVNGVAQQVHQQTAELGSAGMGMDEGQDIDPETFASRQSDLTPGSLVEIRFANDSIPYLAVHLKTKIGNYSREAFMLNPQGTLQLARPNMSRFILPDFIPREKIDTLLNYIKEHGRLRPDLVAEIAGPVREFRRKCQGRYPGILHRVERQHAAIADPVKAKIVSAEEMVKLATGNDEPSQEDTYATHLALLARTDLFRIEQYQDQTWWEIVPTESVERTKKVEAWLRDSVMNSRSEGGLIVQGFVEKAQKVIDFGRKARAERKAVEEMDEKLDVVWDDNEMAILTALEEALEYRRGQMMTLKSLYPHILSKLDRYAQTRLLNEQRLFEFLGEVGVCSPWEDTVVRSRRLALPGHHTNEQADADGEKYAAVDLPGGIDKLKLVDKMAHLRHDWGDLPVYCVDDAQTKDIDDGVSIETIDGSSDVWLRVHVANPTAFIPMDHWIAEIARRRASTFYGVQRNYSMIPMTLSTQKLGLAPKRPAITFSIRVDPESGTPKDFDIRCSVVNNVQRLTYDELNKMFLQPGQAPAKMILSSHSWFPEDAKKTEITPVDLAEDDKRRLGMLYKLSWRLRAQRHSQGAFESSTQTDVSVRADNKHGNKIHPGLTAKPVLDVSEPTITMNVVNRVKSRSSFSWADVIREAMLVAGRGVAEWSAKRGMAQMYRSHAFIWQDKEHEEKWYKALRQAEDEDGYSAEEFWTLYFPVGKAELSPTMRWHTGLGIGGYIKVTSPLRRFTDFISHHIIQRQLLAEAAPEGSEERKALLQPIMPEPELAELCQEIWSKEKQIQSACLASDRLWAMRLLKTLWARKDPQLPKYLKVKIISVEQFPNPMSGLVPALGLSGVRVYFPSNIHRQVRFGDMVKAKLVDWHWSTDSDNVQFVVMDFVDYVETMQQKKEKFWAQVKDKSRVDEWDWD